MSENTHRSRIGKPDAAGSPLPRFVMPEVVGTAMSAAEHARIIGDSIEQMAAGLSCSRLLALSYVARERILRGVGIVGIEFEDVREFRIPIADFPAAERAVLGRQIITLDSPAALPERLAGFFAGETILVPLALGDRTLAVLIGSVESGIASRSAAWRRQAEEVAARAALVVELERVTAAYHDEVSQRQSRRLIGAAILEDRPFNEIADMILQTLCERLRVERAGLYVRDPQGGYVSAALRNISQDYAERVVKLRRPGPVMARAIATGLPYFARDVQNDSQFEPEARSLFRQEHVKSVLIAALHHGETYAGALAVYPDDNRDFTPAELSVFQSFADQATIAVAARNLLNRQREMAILQERQRLAREMHDTVAQSLTALVLQIETAQVELAAGNTESAASLLDTAGAQARAGLEDTRRAVQGLSPASLESQSMLAAIEKLVKEFENDQGVAAQFILTGDEQALTAEQSMAVLRIAQEALTNVHKHANPKRVRVGLQYGADALTLRVEDDGAGFDVDAAPQPGEDGGYGLFGMKERVRLLNGDLQIESTPGWGTRITGVIPYRPGADRPAAGLAAALAPPPPALPGFTPRSADALKVVVVDDHAAMRQGLRGMLEGTGEILVVGEARDGAEAVTEAARARPDVVLMDLQMPSVDGLEGLKRMQETLPEVPVVVLTTFQTQEAVTDALAAGARGFMLKDAEPAQLVAAIRAAHRGEALLAPAVTDRLADLAAHPEHDDTTALNERELEVLAQLAEGARNKEIAERLFIVPRTVEYHLANIYSKLHVSNRTEAVREALARGLVSQSPRGMK